MEVTPLTGVRNLGHRILGGASGPWWSCGSAQASFRRRLAQQCPTGVEELRAFFFTGPYRCIQWPNSALQCPTRVIPRFSSINCWKKKRKESQRVSAGLSLSFLRKEQMFKSFSSAIFLLRRPIRCMPVKLATIRL